MAQETNLNISPYFDDFDPNKNFYKILFKPGYPIQARELTTLQSILQNQIETFGNHVFKEGSVVIPGGVNYSNNLVGVLIQPTFNGIEVDSYIDNLLNKDIIGETSRARARVVHILKANEDTNPFTILFLTLKSEFRGFLSGENLLSESVISPGFSQITSIDAGQPFCTSINNAAPNTSGSALTVNEGVYFIRGYFINVPTQSIILAWNSITPSYSVGFEILEDIITSDDDETLYDNARGFSNYSAPGADRFKISLKLTKRAITRDNIFDSVDKNYVEIFRVLGGEVKQINRNSKYDEISKEFARRTYDESGNYYVKPFTVEVSESINDFLGNGGIYLPGDVTSQNLLTSSNLGVYKISPGKAYVQGYEVESISSQLLDFVKPRTTRELRNQYLSYSTGSSYSLNRVYGTPSLNEDGSYVVSLRDSRVGISSTTAPGKEIGVARVYDFALENGIYNENVMNLNEFDISLYDIQVYNEFTLNENVTLSTPTHIRGSSSGATGFLRFDAVNSGIITAYNISGKFSVGERLIFDDNETNTRFAITANLYDVSDVKSLYGIVGSAYTFTADIKQTIISDFGQVTISGASAGISTVTTSDSNLFFDTILKVDDIVSYSRSGFSTNTFSKVVSISQKSFTISGITTVTDFCDGGLPDNEITVNNIYLLKSLFKNSSQNSLYTSLPKQNLATVDLTDSILELRREFNVQISDNTVVVPPTLLSSEEFFVPFDEEDYLLVREDGELEPLSEDKFSFTDNNKGIIIYGLGADSNARLITTIEKQNIREKTKNIVKVDSIIVDKSTLPGSGIGTTTLNDGLIYGNYPYGTRVQDKEICLNYPDVTKVYAILESRDTEDPVEPRLLLSDINTANATIDNVIFGEKILGSTSFAYGICVGKVNSTTVSYISLNGKNFVDGEVIRFLDSSVSAIVNQVESGSKNISSHYNFLNGQELSIYNYSKVILQDNKVSPSKKIKIIFERSEYSASDEGDLTTVNSYSQFDWCDVPFVYANNCGDIIDARLRVDNYSVTENSRSPLEFLGRTFDQTKNSAKSILASDKLLLASYSYYLGRIDKIYLSKDNSIQVRQGNPSENPLPPEPIENALEVATVVIPPFLCNCKSASVTLTEHKRYRMQDIARLENRIKNLEYYTTLSLLEKDTSNLTIKDSKGLDRFKSGLFVDNFKSTTFQLKKTEVKNSIDISRGELRPAHYTTEIDLLLGDNNILNNEDDYFTVYDQNSGDSLVGVGVTRSGLIAGSTGKGVITLNFEESVEITQPYATRIENVTPYFVTIYEGIMSLNPSSDIWVDRSQLSAITVDGIQGEVTTTTLQLSKEQIDSQSGWSPVVWGSWQEQWTGSTTI